MRIALYARKSQESDDRQIQSLDDQIAALTALAAREGLTIHETFVESKSAKAPGTRPEFARMLETIEAGRIDAVLTWSISRLARNPVDGGRIAYLLQTGRLAYIRTVEKTYRPEDNALLMSIETGMATSFVQGLSRDTLRGMRSKADAGWLTAHAPVGYSNNPATHEIDVDPVRFPLVRKGWDMILNGGATLQDVRRELVRLGLTSPRKGPLRPLSCSSVYRIYSNPFYCGRFAFQGQLRPGRHIPMVTEAEFEEAQARLGRPVRTKRRRHEFALSGLLRCGACGCGVVAERKVKRYSRTERTAEYVYYHCTGGRGCSKRGIREDELLDAFAREFWRVRMPESFAEWAREELARQANEEAGRAAVGDKEVQRSAETNRERLARLSDRWLDGEISRAEYEETKERLAARMRAADRDLALVRTREARLFALIDRKLGAACRAGSFEDEEAGCRRGMVLSLGREHFLTLGKPDIRLSLVMQKIAAFERLRDGSETPKAGDLVPSNSIWGAFINDIRTSARLELEEEDQREATRAGKERPNPPVSA